MKWSYLVAAAVVCVALVAGGYGARTLVEGGAATGDQSSGAQVVNVSAAERALIAQLNVQRKRFGLVKLRSDPVLVIAAGAHSRDMLALGYFAHDEPGGRSYAQRVKRIHRREVAENIAWGTGAFPATLIVRLWMNSPEHRRIILTRRLERVGVSIVKGGFKGNRAAVVVTAEFST